MRLRINVNIAINGRLLLSLTGIFTAITLLIAILAMTVGLSEVPWPEGIVPRFEYAWKWKKNSFFWLPYHLAGEHPYSGFELGKSGIWFLGNYIRITPGYLFILTILYWAAISIAVTTVCYYTSRKIRTRRIINATYRQ